jgi:hypothetical protein
LKIRNRFVADALPSIIEEDGFTHRRDQQSAIALTDVDEVELKVPVGLAEERVVEKQTEAHEQIEPLEHRTSWARNLLRPA